MLGLACLMLSAAVTHSASVWAAPAAGCKAGENPFDCDRRAILAMAGEYRVGFAFDEVTSLRPGYEIKKPLRSGAEEWVEVIEDSGTHIALQHTLVTPEGEVVKHWRQDWDYQPTVTWRYIGNETWERRAVSESERKQAWVQTVWQVDDSPRYSGIGQWIHDGNNSIWTSDTTWRPLPRRESTTRNDYDVMVGINRHEIAADGWTHLQDNLKLDTKAAPDQKYITREFGANRYVKVKDYDFKPGREYWARTKDFWTQVRVAWAERFAKAGRITVKKEVDGSRMSNEMFEAAEKTTPRDAATLKARADAVLDRYLISQPLNK